MIVLDTNVLSELMKREPSPTVIAWIEARTAASMFTTTLTLAEILYGIRLLPSGKRQSEIEEAAWEMFRADFAGRVLSFDQDAAQAYAKVAASRRQAGRPMTQFDAQIAAIALSRDGAVATRNIADFEGCGLDLIDPWLA